MKADTIILKHTKADGNKVINQYMDSRDIDYSSDFNSIIEVLNTLEGETDLVVKLYWGKAPYFCEFDSKRYDFYMGIDRAESVSAAVWLCIVEFIKKMQSCSQ